MENEEFGEFVDALVESFLPSLSMLGNYEERKIGRNEYDWGLISTIQVTDGILPFETGICHRDYSDNVIVVESYQTKEEASSGHEKWVRTMTSDSLPDVLQDCCNAKISQLHLKIRGESFIYPRISKEPAAS